MTAYLDNSATTQPIPAVLRAMEAVMTGGFHNPSTLYAPGLAARKRIEGFRSFLKDGWKARDVLFTSGGTEADNLAILGRMKTVRGRKRLLYSRGEHPAVSAPCMSLAAEHDVRAISLHEDGTLDLDDLSALLDPDTAMICVMQVNNEVGAIQPLDEIIALRNRICPDAVIHVDGVQGFLRLPIWMKNGIDSYAVSAHKVHGPKGTGALFLGERNRIQPQMLGGGQEFGLRSGTENTPGIAGMEAAVRNYPKASDMRLLKLKLLELIRDEVPEVCVNGPDPKGTMACDHILNLSFPPVNAETLMHAMEGEGVFVSNGSACSSRKRTPSAVLTAMRLPKARVDSALRFSLSPYTTHDEIAYAAQSCVSAYKTLFKYKRK